MAKFSCDYCDITQEIEAGSLIPCLIPNKCGGWIVEDRDPLLQEREKTHGSFQIQGTFAHELKMHFRNVHGYTALRSDQREALDMIATKISRVLHGNPMNKDTWDDIAGYAKLGSEACE